MERSSRRKRVGSPSPESCKSGSDSQDDFKVVSDRLVYLAEAQACLEKRILRRLDILECRLSLSRSLVPPPAVRWRAEFDGELPQRMKSWHSGTTNENQGGGEGRNDFRPLPSTTTSQAPTVTFNIEAVDEQCVSVGSGSPRSLTKFEVDAEMESRESRTTSKEETSHVRPDPLIIPSTSSRSAVRIDSHACPISPLSRVSAFSNNPDNIGRTNSGSSRPLQEKMRLSRARSFDQLDAPAGKLCPGHISREELVTDPGATDNPFRYIVRNLCPYFLRDEPTYSTRLSRIVTHPRFDHFISVIIVFNAVFLGYAADYDIDHLHETEPVFFQVIEFIFHGLYVIELSLRMFVHGKWYFLGNEWQWNVFDMILAMTAGFDVIAVAINFQGATTLRNMTFARALRLMRIVKILRLVRAIRFLRELRLMLLAILGSASKLTWALVLILLLLYMSGLIFVHGATTYLRENGDHPSAAEVKKYWSGILVAGTSIYKAMTGGEDWGDMAESAKDVHFGYYLFFLILIGFLVLAVLNILTGIFVNNALEISENDRDNILFEASNERHDFAENIKRIFHDMDDDGDGAISWEEFRTHIHSFKVRANLASLGVDVRDAEGFFKLLANMSGTDLLSAGVDIASFANGCLRLKGVARMIDVQGLAFQMKSLQRMEERLTSFCWEQFEYIRQILGDDSEVELPPLNQKSGVGTAPPSISGSRPVSQAVSSSPSRRPSFGTAAAAQGAAQPQISHLDAQLATVPSGELLLAKLRDRFGVSLDSNPEDCAGVPAVTATGHSTGSAIDTSRMPPKLSAPASQPQALSRSNSGTRGAQKAHAKEPAMEAHSKEGLPSVPNVACVAAAYRRFDNNVVGAPANAVGLADVNPMYLDTVMPSGPRPGAAVRPPELVD